MILLAQPETRQHAVLKHLQKKNSAASIDAARLVLRMRRVLCAIPRSMCMRMAMLIAAAEEPGGGDVHAKTSRGNQDRLVEMDHHRREETRCRLVANEQGDHRKDDGARKSGEIAELSGAENKAGIVGVPRAYV